MLSWFSHDVVWFDIFGLEESSSSFSTESAAVDQLYSEGFHIGQFVDMIYFIALLLTSPLLLQNLCSR